MKLVYNGTKFFCLNYSWQKWPQHSGCWLILRRFMIWYCILNYMVLFLPPWSIGLRCNNRWQQKVNDVQKLVKIKRLWCLGLLYHEGTILFSVNHHFGNGNWRSAHLPSEWVADLKYSTRTCETHSSRWHSRETVSEQPVSQWISNHCLGLYRETAYRRLPRHTRCALWEWRRNIYINKLWYFLSE